MSEVVVLPLKNGKHTPLEDAFIRASGMGMEPIAAAAWAGSKSPVAVSKLLSERPEIGPAARAAARAYLRTEGARVGVAVLVSIAMDEKQPAGARVTAATNLVKLSGIASEDIQGKDPSEMTLDELRQAADATRRRADALTGALADQARPVLEGVTVKASVMD